MHRVWIKDMAVTMAILDEEFFCASGRGQRSIRKKNDGQGASSMRGIGDVNWPTPRFGRSADRIDGAASGGDERSGYVLLMQQCDHAIDCVAFADAAGIELHGGSVGERNGAGGCIEVNFAPACLLFQSEELHFRRDAPVIEEEPPCTHQWADGDVKGSV